MSSITYGGKLLMKAEDDNKTLKNNYDDCFDSYPFEVPKVYLDGTCEDYMPQVCFSWGDDSVVLVKGKRVIKYTQSNFAELLAKDKDGNLIWMDGRSAPYEDCWDGEYLDEVRGGKEFTVTEYDIGTAQKKRYKMVLDKTTEFDSWDYSELSDFVDADTLGSYFGITAGILFSYIGKDKELIIPEEVTELGWNVLTKSQEFESITIPKSLIKIPDSFIERCKTKTINVDEHNPKYYTCDGCLIDKETKTLVWAYAGNVIPRNDCIEKIGISAFYGRDDLESVIIPSTITEIGVDAFCNCSNLEEIEIANSVIKIECGAFLRCKKLSKIILPNKLTTIERCTFAECSNLNSVYIPNSVTIIDSGAFAYCDSLEQVNLPEDCIHESKEWFGAQLTKENGKWFFEPKERKVCRTFKDFSF